MIRNRWDIDVSSINDLILISDRYTDLVEETGQETFDALYGNLTDELQYYPPPPPDSTYIRTFKLRDGWEIRLRRTDNGIEVVIENAVSYGKFVVGSLAKAIAAAKAFQAKVHQGRWPLATETVQFWYQAFVEEFEKRLGEKIRIEVKAKVSKRAFTR